MELRELHRIAELSELDLLYEMIEIIQSNKKDAERILRGEKEAGIRVRNKMQDVKLICEIIRDKIQEGKGVEWEKRKNSALDRAIKIAQKREEQKKESNEKRRQERIARLQR
jgi:hypothetical protein